MHEEWVLEFGTCVNDDGTPYSQQQMESQPYFWLSLANPRVPLFEIKPVTGKKEDWLKAAHQLVHDHNMAPKLAEAFEKLLSDVEGAAMKRFSTSVDTWEQGFKRSDPTGYAVWEKAFDILAEYNKGGGDDNT